MGRSIFDRSHGRIGFGNSAMSVQAEDLTRQNLAIRDLAVSMAKGSLYQRWEVLRFCGRSGNERRSLPWTEGEQNFW